MFCFCFHITLPLKLQCTHYLPKVVELLDNAAVVMDMRKANNVALETLTVEEVTGFLSMKHLTMFVDKFSDLQLSGAKIKEVFQSESNAKVFLQSISKDVIDRFRELCDQGVYNITDAKRNNYTRAMKHYEEKLCTAFNDAISQGVDSDEINDEAFSLSVSWVLAGATRSHQLLPRQKVWFCLVSACWCWSPF